MNQDQTSRTKLTMPELQQIEDALNGVEMYRGDGGGWVSVADPLAVAIERIIAGRVADALAPHVETADG